MSNFLSGPVQVAAQTLHSSSADQYHKLGELIFANDGRAFRYAKAGGSALVAGDLQQSQAEDTDTQGLTAVAAAVGDLSIVSTSTVTVTANEYAEGFILASVTPGLGIIYKIKGHIAYTTAAPTFNLDNDSVRVALTTTSRLDALANPYAATVVAPTSKTGPVVGAAVHAIAASEFGWLQVLGAAALTCDATEAVVIGEPVIRSNGVAGAVEGATTTFTIQGTVGFALTGIAVSESGAVKLTLL